MYGEILAFVGLIQYFFVVNISQPLWILIDGSTVPLSWAITLAKPALKLARTRPTARLLGFETISSVVGQIAISLFFMILIVVLLFSESWFSCHQFDGSRADIRRWWELSDSYESEVTALITVYQIIHAGAAFNIGHVYRLGFFRNIAFLAFYSAIFSLLTFITLADPNSIGCIFRINCGTSQSLSAQGYAIPWYTPLEYHSAFGHNVMPFWFRVKLVIVAVSNLLAVLFFEWFVVLGPVRTWIKSRRPVGISEVIKL